MNRLKLMSLLTVAFVLGAISVKLVPYVLAHGGDLLQIHSCVRTSSGSIRIVGANDVCNTNETALDWNIQGVAGPTGPSAIGGFISNQFTNTYIGDMDFRYRNLNGSNFSGSDLDGAKFDNGLLIGANLSNTNASNTGFMQTNVTNADFSGTSFNNANFEGATISGAIFTGATWVNSICSDGSNSDNNGNTCEGH